MKWLAAIVAAVCAAIAAVIFLWPVQRVGAEPINYERDTCAYCRMHLSRRGFAGELRDRNGALTKYDDVGCMLRAMVGMHREIPEAWVEDHDGNGFFPLLNASLVQADNIETPMGYGIVTFKDEVAAHAFALAHRGQVLGLEDLLKDPARLVPGRTSATSPTTQEVR